MKGEITINGVDAYVKWGITLSDSGIATLMQPVPLKDYIESKSRLRDGKSVINTVKRDERSLSLPFSITAPTREAYLERYASFCQELEKGVLNIWMKYTPDKTYKCIYRSCSQFSQFLGGIANLTLKVDEPDPSDRD
jgi:hypothetical protein